MARCRKPCFSCIVGMVSTVRSLRAVQPGQNVLILHECVTGSFFRAAGFVSETNAGHRHKYKSHNFTYVKEYPHTNNL